MQVSPPFLHHRSASRARRGAEVLESLVRRPWQPALTPDRLAAILSLLESCGAINNEDGAYAIRADTSTTEINR